MPRRFVVLSVFGLIAATGVGIGAIAAGDRAFGALVIVVAVVGALLNLWLVRRGLRLDRPGPSPRRGKQTGRVLAPGSLATPPAPQRSWTGGGNVPSDLGRMNATWPLAVLTVSDRTLALRFRPRFLLGIFGLRNPFEWTPETLGAVYPVRGRFTGLTRGIAVESTTAGVAYFWITRPELVLTDLAARGLPVDWTERQVRLL